MHITDTGSLADMYMIKAHICFPHMDSYLRPVYVHLWCLCKKARIVTNTYSCKLFAFLCFHLNFVDFSSELKY